MIVVSNTSPMTNLAAIGQVALLRQLYGGVYIPEAVYRELRVGESRGDHPPFLEAADWWWRWAIHCVWRTGVRRNRGDGDGRR